MPAMPAPRTLLCLLFSLALLPTAATAQTDEEKRAAMNAAYRQYQELMSQGPQMRAQAEAPAREAYELALEVLGDAHDNLDEAAAEHHVETAGEEDADRAREEEVH